MSGKTRRILSLVLSLGLLFQQIGFAQVATELNIANHLARMASSFTVDKFRPVHLRYFSYDILNDNFKVLLDKGDVKNLRANELENSTKTLLNYFLVGVTLPDSMFWVNLRPDSEDQVIDPYLEKTDIGKIMLEADLKLKKDTALYTSPQTPEGREYWNRLYKKAAEIFGNENIEIPTLTRPWIVPGEIIIRESSGQGLSPQGTVPNAPSAYIYKANLKVMLEQDYLQSQPTGVIASEAKQSLFNTYSFKDERLKALNEYSTQLIRELIIPKLTKEVNSSKRYAPLRQVYYSLILSRWFKLRFADLKGLSPSTGTVPVKANTYLTRGTVPTFIDIINKQDLTNLTSQEPWSKTDYFKQYQKSFTDGEYNIKEPVYTPTGQVIRSYFSGGIEMGAAASPINNRSGIVNSAELSPERLSKLGVLMKGGSVGGIQISAASPIITSDKESAISVLRNFTLFGGNWKERKDITTEEGARAKAREFKNRFAKAKGLGQAVIVIFPEERWIKPVAEELAGTNIIVGVQSKFFGESENPNNFTPVNLQKKINLAVAMGAKYANVGHSMHRKLYINRQHREKGEPEEKGLTDEQANKIMQAILQDGRLIPWYTIEISGERDAQDEIADGVNIGLARITKEQIAAFPITPEPSGKISTKEGTGVVDTTIKVDAQDTAFLARLILQALEAKYGHPVQVNVGYGASVKGENAEGIFGNREIKNALIGGASLEAQDFLDTVVNGMKGKASASSPINYADAKIAFESSYFMNINPAVFNSPLVLKANQYELMGEEYNFPEPDGSLSSRFGYKDPKGALRIDNRTEIMDWINKRKSEGSKVMLHFGIGGQGMSNSVQAEYWGTDKNARVIVMDRLGVNMRKLFEDLLDQGYKASEIILDVSSKSGTTDEPLSLFQDALNKFLYFVALENDMSIDAAKRLEDEFVNFLKDVNKSKDAKKDIFFTPMPVDDFLKRFNDQEREIIGKVFQRMVFTTSRNVKASRLFAFAQGMKELKVADIAVFDFSEYTGGRFTENSESGATTQAFQGLPADQVTLDLQRHTAVYWGDEGNDPNKNSALRAAILTRKLDPSVMIVAVRSSNARSEALQKEQLFPESNGKDGQGSWVVVSIGEKELARKVKQIISQTGQAPLVITVDQEGFAPMAVPDGVPTIRYYKSEISPLANAKFALWFQEFTVRYGLLSLAGMGIELDIPRVGASLMNKPKLDGKPNFWWLRDPQNQPMVELAKSALVSDLVGLGRTDQEIKNRYENEEKRIKGGRYIEDAEINAYDHEWGTSFNADSKHRLLLSAEDRIGLAAESLENIVPEVTEQSVLATLERIRLLKSQVESLAAELKVARSNNDRLGIQERIEEIDDSISRFYNSIRSFGKGRLSDSYMESAANKLAALMLITRDKNKIFSPVFYTADPNADILGEFLQAVDYGIGTRDQHANFQHRNDGKDVVFTVLVDFVMTYEQVKAQQEKIRTFGLANDYLEGLYPDELRRGFINAELKSLSGEVKVDAINHLGREYEKRFHRDVAKLLLPDISTPEGMLTAMRIFNRAQALFDAYSSLEAEALSSMRQAPGSSSASSAIVMDDEEAYQPISGQVSKVVSSPIASAPVLSADILRNQQSWDEAIQWAVSNRYIFGGGFGYDIRINDAVSSQEAITKFQYVLGRVLGAMYLHQGDRALITADHRSTSLAFRLALTQGLLDAGVNVTTQRDDEAITTGLPSRKGLADNFDLIIQITGSHNPPQANGDKIVLKGLPFFGQQLNELEGILTNQEEVNRLLRGDILKGAASVQDNLVLEHIDTLDKVLPALKNPSSLIVDFRSGAGGSVFVGLSEKKGYTIVRLDSVDAELPDEIFIADRPVVVVLNEHPSPSMKAGIWDPSKPEAFSEIKKLQLRIYNDSRFKGKKFAGMVFDGDGDRVGLSKEGNENHPGEEIMPERMLISYYQRMILANIEGIKVLNRLDHIVKLALDVRASGLIIDILRNISQRYGVGVEGEFIPAGYPNHRAFVLEELTAISELISRHPELSKDESDSVRKLMLSYTSAEASGHFFFNVLSQGQFLDKRIVVDDGITSAFMYLDLVNTLDEYELQGRSGVGKTFAMADEILPALPVTKEVRLEKAPNDVRRKQQLAEEIVRQFAEDNQDLLPITLSTFIQNIEEARSNPFKRQNADENPLLVDGIRIMLNNGVWFLFRKSNTSAVITFKAEAVSNDKRFELISVLRLLSEAINKVKTSSPDFKTLVTDKFTAEIEDLERKFGSFAASSAVSVEERVKSIVAKKLGVKLEAVTLDASFVSLKSGYMYSVDMWLGLEEEFDIRVPEGVGARITTVGEAVKYFEERTNPVSLAVEAAIQRERYYFDAAFQRYSGTAEVLAQIGLVLLNSGIIGGQTEYFAHVVYNKKGLNNSAKVAARIGLVLLELKSGNPRDLKMDEQYFREVTQVDDSSVTAQDLAQAGLDLVRSKDVETLKAKLAAVKTSEEASDIEEITQHIGALPENFTASQTPGAASSAVAETAQSLEPGAQSLTPGFKPQASSSLDNGMGGIDFRALPMAIQPMGSFQGLNFRLPQLSQAELEKMNVAVEMQQIKNMLQAGIIPSGQRIKEFIAACVQKGEINSQIDNLLLCLADTFKLEEENASESSPELREALVIVDSQS